MLLEGHGTAGPRGRGGPCRRYCRGVSAPFWGETPPATQVSPDEAVALARDIFGVDGVAEPLGSNQETNLRVRSADGSSYVLKVANPAFGADVLDLQNKVLRVTNADGSVEHQFVISDLGATFGKLGNNNLPFFFRLGRRTNDPGTWFEAGFIDGVENGIIDFAFKGKGRKLMDDITVEQGRWLAQRLRQLSDKQLNDAFRAANYSADDIKLLRIGTRERTAELERAVGLSGAVEARQ